MLTENLKNKVSITIIKNNEIFTIVEVIKYL